MLQVVEVVALQENDYDLGYNDHDHLLSCEVDHLRFKVQRFLENRYATARSFVLENCLILLLFRT